VKTIVFDFDKTLTYIDTWNPFLFYCGKRKHFYRARMIIYLFFVLLQKVKFIQNIQLKKIGVFLFLQKLTKKNLEHDAECFSKTLKMNSVFNSEFPKEPLNGQRVFVISASISDYIKCICPSATVIASELKFVNNNVVGLNSHIYGNEKRRSLKDNYHIQEIDVLYTDSISDMALVDMAKEINLVANDNIIPCKNSVDFVRKVSEFQPNLKDKVRQLYQNFIN